MNCLTAREALDLCLPDEACLHDVQYDAHGNALPAGTFDEAARHVKGCPACQTAMRRREKFDERVGQLTRDVAVPVGLRERLLERLEREAASSGDPGQPSQATVAPLPVSLPAAQPQVRSRRRMIISAAAAGVLALSLGVWKLAVSGPAAMSMNEIAGYALSDSLQPDELPALAQFKGSVDVQVPKTMGTLTYGTPFRRLNDPQLADREIAVYFFTLPGRNGRKIPGRLVVIPVALVKDPPAFTSFPGQTLYYSNGFCTTSWVEGKFVYLACVEGGEGELYLLRPPPTQAA